MKLIITLLLCILGMPVYAERHKLKHDSIPSQIKLLKPISDLENTNQLHVAIVLPLRNQPELDSLLKELYNPASKSFRKWLKPEQFADRFGPTTNDYATVTAWATTNGLTIQKKHKYRGMLEVESKVPNMEKAFGVKMKKYRHPKETRNVFAPDREPTVESNVPVLGIIGLDDFNRPTPALTVTNIGVNALGGSFFGYYSGQDFRTAYVPGTALTGSNQSVGIFALDMYDTNEIYEYIAGVGMSTNIITSLILSNINVYGGFGPPSGGIGQDEVSMDIELSIAMAPGLKCIYVYNAPATGFGFFGNLFQMAEDNYAKQLSVSWFLGYGYAGLGDYIFKQMAAQGQSIFTSSGDSCAFSGPIPFPEENPWVTVVGGTYLTSTNYTSNTNEQTWSWYVSGVGSGGGIGTYYQIPYYQTNINMSSNQGSTTYRNVPDVSAVADDIIIRSRGGWNSAGGTSASSPLWAGFAALVNEKAELQHKSSVGFLNPTLYALARSPNYTNIFHDITIGNNTNASSPNKFYATNGYDLCTGLGTPTTNLINSLLYTLSITFSNGLFMGAH